MVILQHLVERAGAIVSKQALIDAGWKDAHVGEASLTEAIGIIRQALDDDPQQPRYIQTVHRRGYRFIAPIAVDAAAAAPSAVEAEPAAQPVESCADGACGGAALAQTTAARQVRPVVIVVATALRRCGNDRVAMLRGPGQGRLPPLTPRRGSASR